MNSRHGSVRIDRVATPGRGWVPAMLSAGLISFVVLLIIACSRAPEVGGFRLFREKADANPSVWPALSSRGDEIMADPGEPCEVGCIRFGRDPDMCLMFGGQSKTHVFLVYHQGSFFLRTMLVVFELKEDQANIVWHDDLGRYKDDKVPGLREAIAQGASLRRRQSSQSWWADVGDTLWSVLTELGGAAR